MKRFIFTSAVICSLIFGACCVSANDSFETWYVGATGGLNCRQNPATDADILAVYPHKTDLQIIGIDSTGEWWETWDGTIQGWCQKKYLVSDPNSPGTYLGTFRISHYCPCYGCNGSYGASTAWAGPIIPGQTIAVDPSVIPKMKNVYIDGYGTRRAEDCGGAIKGNRIDLAVSTHQEAMAKGVVYKDVYLVD